MHTLTSLLRNIFRDQSACAVRLQGAGATAWQGHVERAQRRRRTAQALPAGEALGRPGVVVRRSCSGATPRSSRLATTPESLAEPENTHEETGSTYRQRRGQLRTYFDRTAVEAWSRLTSDAPVSRIRATVRAGREQMRATLLDWLPADLSGLRLLDAGCGTGMLAVEAARRGADVVAVDLSPTLVNLGRERAAREAGPGRLAFRVGDMLDPELGRFDHVVAMDALIHYRRADMVLALADLTGRTRGSLLFTFAPRTPALALMHAAGRLFPRRDRAPAIEPVSERRLHESLRTVLEPRGWWPGRSRRVAVGFYTSQALELRRACDA